jgi:hypothetical protein
MKRPVLALLFVLLTAEGPSAYASYWHLPFSWTYTLLFDWKPLVAPFIDIFLVAIVLGGAPLQLSVDPVRRALGLSTLSLAAWAGYGIMTGGSAYQVQFQIHTLLVSFLFAVACRRALRTPEDYLDLGRTVVYAAVYRGVMCIAFYLFVMRPNLLDPPPQFCTSHDDTVLFVSALVGLWAYWGLVPNTRTRSQLLFASVIILAGIHLNNRRLAWVSLVSALALLYAVLPANGLRQLVKRRVLRVAPWIALYVLVGWGRPETVFAPLRSVSSVSSGEDDASTRSRDFENAGLIYTLRENPLLGSGWGKEYIELDDSLSAREFTQYRYVPHNSVLGLLAFCGFLGFAGVWLIWPVCAYLAARAAQRASDPYARYFGMVILVTLVVVINQMWGDMGLFSYTTTFIMAAASACASHLVAFEPRLESLTQPPVPAGDNKLAA